MTLPFRRRHNDAETSHDRARALSSRRLLEALDADEEAWLGRHLETCTACLAEDEAFAADQALLRSLRGEPIEPPRDLWARTSAALDAAAGNRGTLPFERAQPGRPGGGGANRWWRTMPVGMAAAAAVVLVVVGSTVLPGLVGTAPQATDQTAVGPSIVPGATAINVDTAAIPAARVRADGSIDLFFTKVREVCPTSRPECVPAPSQQQGSTVDLQGAKASTVTLSPSNDRLVFESASGPASEGKIFVVPLGSAGQPSQPPPASPSTGSSPPSEPPVSGGPTPEPTPIGQIEILSGVTVVGEVAYSPDEHWLAFSAAPKDGSTGPDLYLYAVGSTTAIAVTSDHQTYFSAWLGNRVLASHIAVPAGAPGAPGNPNASKGPDASGNGNNGQGNGGQGQAIEGRASSFLFDPATNARTELVQPDVWMPVVDAHSRFVTYWAGTLRSTDGVSWQLGDGQVVLDGWNVGASTTPGASAEAPAATDANASPEPAIGPAGHATPVVDSHVEDFRAKFDPDGVRLAVWVSERAGETDGRLHLLVIDATTGALRPDEPLPGEPALRRFSIDENRLAWVSPSGQDGHESALQVLGWDGDTFGQIHAEQDANLLILR